MIIIRGCTPSDSIYSIQGGATLRLNFTVYFLKIHSLQDLFLYCTSINSGGGGGTGACAPTLRLCPCRVKCLNKSLSRACARERRFGSRRRSKVPALFSLPCATTSHTECHPHARSKKKVETLPLGRSTRAGKSLPRVCSVSQCHAVIAYTASKI